MKRKKNIPEDEYNNDKNIVQVEIIVIIQVNAKLLYIYM